MYPGDQTINTIVGNEKVYARPTGHPGGAYEIIKRLKADNEINLLSTLHESVEAARRANKKKHEVWKLSFDWKLCNSRAFIKQKLNYMHDNPCSGKWNYVTAL